MSILDTGADEYRPENQLHVFYPNKEDLKILSGQGEMEKTEFGAMRESNEGRGRFDLLPYEAIEALAKWYEAGATKYAERNWEQGISVKDCINRMIRHALKAGNGWTDEDHLAAVMWNAAAAITMMQRHPACNDHVWKHSEIEPVATHTILSDDDVEFLIMSLQSKGINDIETLMGWLNRRL